MRVLPLNDPMLHAPAPQALHAPVTPLALPHAVSRLRTTRLARSTRPFLARGGPSGERCEGCRLRAGYCMCALRPVVPTRAGVCLLMHDAEPLKPSNTGWLIADVVADTFAFGWARKMFRKSPYLDSFPVLSLQSEQLSRYKLRRSQRDEHFCTSEVAALCLELAGETHAAQTLEAYLDVFTSHYLDAKNQRPVDIEDAAHQRLRALRDV